MTYTVKNGTWCKDNNKEYYSTTKTGLKAALAAGEITSGTKVIIHEPQYHAGQLIQSLNPECPEGCFVPHGQAFDTNIYIELAKLFPDGSLPDMRECVMVCAGENTHITTHEHDVFDAGEFKDDCAIKHSHTITVNDPGHNHSVTDQGHSHSITDPGHNHGPGDMDITGEFITDKNSIVYKGAFTAGEIANKQSGSGEGTGRVTHFNAAKSWTGKTESVKTGVSVKSDNANVSVNSNSTGITAECSQAGDTDATVTRTKQFGVYYYIAF